MYIQFYIEFVSEKITICDSKTTNRQLSIRLKIKQHKITCRHTQVAPVVTYLNCSHLRGKRNWSEKWAHEEINLLLTKFGTLFKKFVCENFFRFLIEISPKIKWHLLLTYLRLRSLTAIHYVFLSLWYANTSNGILSVVWLVLLISF